MYGIRGEKKLDELVLDHLEGYRESAPVRIGNGAYDHLQLDIYGELLDGIYVSCLSTPIIQACHSPIALVSCLTNMALPYPIPCGVL